MTLERNAPAVATLLALGLAACGGPPPPLPPPAPPPPVEISLEAATVHRAEAPVGEAVAPSEPASESARVVQQALDARQDALVQCYEDVLRQSPDAMGRISVEIAVNATGTPERVAARVEGEGGLARARTCVEQALRAVQVPNPPPEGLRIRRSYSFVNPPVEIAVTTPLAISARRPRRAAPAPAPTEPGTGVLTEAEVQPAVAARLSELQGCYTTLLRTARNAAGTATLTFHVSGEGAVPEAALTDATGPLEGLGPCVSGVVRTLHFRASGTGANVSYPLSFTR